MNETPTQAWKVDLSGQVAVVTGASQGLGRAIAMELARSGARVACIARTESKLADAVAAIVQAGGCGGSVQL